MNKYRGKYKDISELNDPYFDLQAEVGITKHPGGLRATEELVELCRIGAGKHILVVGCGVGTTACFLAKRYGCRVVGVDVSLRMIERANERAVRQGLAGRIEFRMADAQNLPFDDGSFDAVISESVTAFVEDKGKAVREYARVTKAGGFVGLNETTWMDDNPPKELVEYVCRAVGGVRPETSDGWRKLIEDALLLDIVVRNYRMEAFSQFVNEVKFTGIMDFLRAWYRFFVLFVSSPVYRKAMYVMAKDAGKMPKGFLKYYGYGIYVGRK